MSSSPSLALLAPLLTTQLDGVAVALKDVTDRIEAIRAAAQVAERKPAPIKPPERDPKDDPKDDADRIVTLAEAARLMGVSVDTLRRRYRHKFIALSEHRFGMRRRDALLL
jgi:hypothetical protein